MHLRRDISNIPWLGLLLVGPLPSCLKTLYYRARGAKIGRRVRFGLLSYIRAGTLEIGDDTRIAPLTFIVTRKGCTIGKRCHIQPLCMIDTGEFTMGDDARLREHVVVGGLLTPRSKIAIGARSHVHMHSILNPTEPLIIGDDVCIGGGSYLFTHSSWQSALDGFPCHYAGITIGNGAWLGWRSFIMPGVTIGKEATIGGGAVVTSDVGARELAVGSPAKVIKRGGEYIAPPSADAQHALIQSWLGEMAENLTYRGIPSRYENTATGGILICGAQKLYYTNGEMPAVHAGEVVISLAALSHSTRLTFAGRSIGWFDLAARECSLSDSALWAETREWFLRTGVRFTPSETA